MIYKREIAELFGCQFRTSTVRPVNQPPSNSFVVPQTHMGRMASARSKNSDHRGRWAWGRALKWRGALCGIALCCVVVVVYMVAPNGNRRIVSQPIVQVESPSPTNTFKYASDKLVIIKCGDGVGSGFIIEEGTNRYLVTNEHVLRGGKGARPVFRMLSGTELGFHSIDIAEDRDLVRIPINETMPAFCIERTLPEIGDKVKVFGNSEGGGVATELEGVVQGIGPLRIETDAKYVRGNSGSPLVNGVGHVVGVATLITCQNDKRDWTKKGTRFNEVRRYAVRLNSVKWQSYTWDEYSEYCKQASDIATFLEALYPYLLAFYDDVDESFLMYGELSVAAYQRNGTGLHKCMMAVAETYETLDRAFAEWRKYAKGRESFVERLKSAENLENRTAYLDEYDRAIQVEQAKLIERLYDFNEAKDDALAKLQKEIKSLGDCRFAENGYEGERGLKELRKAVSLLRKDLSTKLTNGNVREVAIDLITGRNDSKTNVGLGSLLLYDWAADGDQQSQSSFVDMYLDGKIELTNGELSKVKPWFWDAYQKGNRKAAFILGGYEYSKRNFAAALRFWEISAKAGVGEGWLRIGKYYSFPEDCGGGPISERSDVRAKEAFTRAAAFNERPNVVLEGKEELGRVLLRSEYPADWKNAAKEFRELSDKDSNSEIYPFYYGVAYWKMCLNEWDERVACYREKAKYWISEKERADTWLDKHRGDSPDEFVDSWNRAVATKNRAIAKIKTIFKPFERDEKPKLIIKLKDALSYVERAERNGVDGAKALAESYRKQIKELQE